MQGIPERGNWLDIGCGSGALAAEWLRQKRQGVYFGIDFSSNLIAEAGEEIRALARTADLEIQFQAVDLINDGWEKPFKNILWDGALCFAVLHHIPGAARRQKICAAIAHLLGRGKSLYLSVWQVHNSPRLMQRIQPWRLAGVDEADLEAGDVLMDWRAESGDANQQNGLRYVHIFEESELASLAEAAGFEVVDSFFSDGKEGNLGLYQTWKVKY